MRTENELKHALAVTHKTATDATELLAGRLSLNESELDDKDILTIHGAVALINKNAHDFTTIWNMLRT